jgi:hypothetical protein
MNLFQRPSTETRTLMLPELIKLVRGKGAYWELVKRWPRAKR